MVFELIKWNNRIKYRELRDSNTWEYIGGAFQFFKFGKWNFCLFMLLLTFNKSNYYVEFEQKNNSL